MFVNYTWNMKLNNWFEQSRSQQLVVRIFIPYRQDKTDPALCSLLVIEEKTTGLSSEPALENEILQGLGQDPEQVLVCLWRYQI